MKRALYFSLLILISTITCLPVKAQTESVKPEIKDTVAVTSDNQMDVIDLARLVLKKPNLFKRKKNLNGPFITAIPYPGYTIATGIAGVLPINIAFYTDKKFQGNLSFFNNNFQYTQYKQAIAFSLSNLFFNHDKWMLIGDWRYYNFPTFTYGIGSYTTFADQDRINYSHLRVYEMVMRKIVPDLDMGIGYHFDYHWGISDFNADNGIVTDFQRYGYQKRSISSGLSVNLIYDTRGNPNNPKNGMYFNMQFRTNLKVLGGSSNWNILTLDARKYVKLPVKWNMGLAFWAYAWITTNGKPPYLDLAGTGMDTYNNSGRGYAMGRYRGKNMLYFETEFRFSILKSGLLGGVVFANIQTLSEYPGNNFATVQPGGGLGLRIKLNKRTDTNSAVDYGFGSGGSRGFAFNLNEVF